MERYKFLAHTADAKFQAFGETLEEAFGNAALATASATRFTSWRIGPICDSSLVATA